MHRFLSIEVALGFALIVSVAQATEPGTASSELHSATAKAPESKALTQAEQEAAKLFEEAEARYIAKDFEGARRCLERCFELTGDESLLFNIAQLHRKLSNCTLALDFYQRYVESAKDGERVADANRFIEELTAQCGSPPKAANQTPRKLPAPSPPESVKPRPLPPPPPPPREVNRTWPVVGWVSVGTAVVSAAASTYFTVGAIRAKRDTEKANIDASFYTERNNDLFRNSVLAGAFGTTALIATGLGIYSFAVAAPKERAKTTTSWSVVALPNTLFLGALTRF
jgi:tetratricopeptide (TPR) repeat protein